MLRYCELPPLSELPAVDDDPALFDPFPEWFVPGLRSSVQEGHDDDGLGLRSLLEHPKVLSKAWRTATRERFADRRKDPRVAG
jgi:hypothetical protein